MPENCHAYENGARLGRSDHQEPEKMPTRSSTASSASSKTKTKLNKLKSYFTKQVARDVLKLPAKGETLIDIYKYKPGEDGHLVTKKRFQKRSGSRSGTDDDSDSDAERPKASRKPYRGDKFREGTWDDERGEVKFWRQTSKQGSDADLAGREMEDMNELRQAEEAWTGEGGATGMGEQESGVVDAGQMRDVRL